MPSYQVKSSPVVHRIAVRVSGSYGHVAWVTTDSGSTITVTEMNCWGNYGMRTQTYAASFFDGGFIVRAGQCACTIGQTQSQSCGPCGTQSRTCNSSCQRGAWSTCCGGGSCAPGQSETQDCGNCGKKNKDLQLELRLELIRELLWQRRLHTESDDLPLLRCRRTEHAHLPVNLPMGSLGFLLPGRWQPHPSGPSPLP